MNWTDGGDQLWGEVYDVYLCHVAVREMDCFHQIKEPPFDWAFLHPAARYNYWQAVSLTGLLTLGSIFPPLLSRPSLTGALIRHNQDRKPAPVKVPLSATSQPPESADSYQLPTPLTLLSSDSKLSKTYQDQLFTGLKLYRLSFDDFFGGNHNRFPSVLSENVSKLFHGEIICTLDVQILFRIYKCR